MSQASIERDQFSPGQVKAFDRVMDWMQDPQGAQVFALFGFAGTGKTTMAKAVVRETGKHPAYMAFTGKAALVMQRAGCTDASTIHGAIYSPEENEETGEVTYELNHDGAASRAGLIVVDECSMVDPVLGQDLLSFGKPVLVLGDPFQLPPVNGAGFFTARKPDALLTEVHRQAQGNPILRAATAVREGRRHQLRYGTYGDGRLRIVPSGSIPFLEGMAYDQVLVGKNATRRDFNGQVKDHRGGGRLPIPGDRLVCLKNDRERGLLNGGLFVVLEVRSTAGRWIKLRAVSEDFPDREPQDLRIRSEFFTGDPGRLTPHERKETDHFDYGFALTVHKSQGSQWDRVLLYDEGRSFDEPDRWLYTGLTRASQELTLSTTLRSR